MPARKVLDATEDGMKEAIAALGGVMHVAELLGFKGPNAVRNWYKRCFPPEAHWLLAPRLRKAGCEFSDVRLFNQYDLAPPPKEAPAKKNGGRKK